MRHGEPVSTRCPVSVLVVDDQRPFRMAARAVLERAAGFVLVGEAASAEEGCRLVEEVRPDLVLMAVHLSGMDGIDGAAHITSLVPGTVVFLCSGDAHAELPARAGTSGAVAHLHKSELDGGMLERLWRAHAPADRL